MVPSISNIEQTTRWGVDGLTGLVTFSPDLSGTVTSATSTNPCQLTVAGHGLTTGDTVHLSTFTGVWAALNDQRQAVTVVDVNNVTVPVDTSAVSLYSANGGELHTFPQAGEPVTADFDHAFPVRFDTPVEAPQPVLNRLSRLGEVVLVEVRE